MAAHGIFTVEGQKVPERTPMASLRTLVVESLEPPGIKITPRIQGMKPVLLTKTA